MPAEAGLDVANGPPPWFNPDVFQDPQFDGESYVQDLRRYVPLEALSRQLSEHLAELNRKVGQLNSPHKSTSC